jgi:uncharacterized membrane protein YecN with MAPEG domain
MELQDYIDGWVVSLLSIVLVVARIVHATAFISVHSPKVHLAFRATGIFLQILFYIAAGCIVFAGSVKNLTP